MPFPIIPLAIAAGGAIANWFGANRQHRKNRELAQFQADAQERYLQEQLEYNTPKNQMRRFQDAGLNPFLVYGQGNPGNQTSPLSYPDVQPGDFQGAAASIAPLINQSLMTQSQTSALDARTRREYVMADLNRLQTRVLEKNPLLNDEGFKAILDSLKASAEIKGTEAVNSLMRHNRYAIYGEQQIIRELDLLEQRFRLGELDAKLKAEVLTSKEFQNAILEVQKRWMTNAEITPQHILQFIQLLLLKLF